MKKYQRKMKNNTLIYVSIAICILILGIVYFVGQPTEPNVVKTDTVFTTKTDTLWRDTTITEKEFIPKIIVKTKVDTVFTKEGDTVQLITESKSFEKRLISDKDTADVKVFTTGINTSLDSLKMRLKTHKEIITNTVEVTKYVEKKKTVWDRFHIGIQGGYGYGFNYKGLEPYVGIGGSFDL